MTQSKFVDKSLHQFHLNPSALITHTRIYHRDKVQNQSPEIPLGASLAARNPPQRKHDVAVTPLQTNPRKPPKITTHARYRAMNFLCFRLRVHYGSRHPHLDSWRGALLSKVSFWDFLSHWFSSLSFCSHFLMYFYEISISIRVRVKVRVQSSQSE